MSASIEAAGSAPRTGMLAAADRQFRQLGFEDGAVANLMAVGIGILVPNERPPVTLLTLFPAIAGANASPHFLRLAGMSPPHVDLERR